MDNYKGTLFERLAGKADGYTGLSAGEALRASLESHLDRLLNTHVNAVSAAMDYGIPDLNDLRFSTYDAIHRMRRHIQTVIPKFEPRLSNVSVSHRKSSDPFTVNFVIEGDVLISNEPMKMQFNAHIGNNARVSVEQK